MHWKCNRFIKVVYVWYCKDLNVIIIFFHVIVFIISFPAWFLLLISTFFSFHQYHHHHHHCIVLSYLNFISHLFFHFFSRFSIRSFPLPFIYSTTHSFFHIFLHSFIFHRRISSWGTRVQKDDPSAVRCCAATASGAGQILPSGMYIYIYMCIVYVY